MSLAVALLAGALLVVWAAPHALSGLTRRIRRPDLLLTWWITVTAGAAAAVLAAGGLLLAGGWPHPTGGLGHPCWAALGHMHVHPADEIIGAVVIVAVLAALARASWFAAHSLHAGRRAHRAHVAMLNFAPADENGVLWLAHEHPFAYSVAGSPGLIVASTGLRRLPTRQREAILAHERRHLRGRHHLLMLAAAAAADALPKLLLLRRLPQAVEELTERIADAHAVRVCGADAVAGARIAVSGGISAPLSRDAEQPPTLRGKVQGLVAAAGPLSAPALAGAVLLFAGTSLWC